MVRCRRQLATDGGGGTAGQAGGGAGTQQSSAGASGAAGTTGGAGTGGSADAGTDGGCLYRSAADGSQICLTPRCPDGTIVGSALGMLKDDAGRNLVACARCGAAVDCACGSQCDLGTVGQGTWCTAIANAVTPWGSCVQ